MLLQRPSRQETREEQWLKTPLTASVYMAKVIATILQATGGLSSLVGHIS